MTARKPKGFIVGLAFTNLKLRIELFNRVPSGINMVLAFEVIEAIIMNEYKHGRMKFNEKRLERYEKLKNLALGNLNFNERKLAFTRSIQAFEKIMDKKI